MANSLVCNGVVGKCSEFHSHYIGNIDNKDSKFVAGWVRSKGDLPASLSVSLFIDGKRVQSDTADKFRQDLHDKNIGDCLFHLEIPGSFVQTLNDEIYSCCLVVSDGASSHFMGVGSFCKQELSLSMDQVDLELFEHTEFVYFTQNLVEYNQSTSIDTKHETDNDNYELPADNLGVLAKADLGEEDPKCKLVDEESSLAESSDRSYLNPVDRSETFSLFSEYFHGNVDEVGVDFVRGWVVSQENNIDNVSVMLMVDGRYKARIVANNFRKDVCDAGYGDGHSGFKIDLKDYGMNQSDLCGSELVIEVASEETIAVMHSCTLPTEFGSLSKACKAQIIAAFDQFQQPDLLVEANNEQDSVVPESNTNGLVDRLFRSSKSVSSKSSNNEIPNLSPYIVFTRDRLGQTRNFEFEDDPGTSIDLLLWYLQAYGGTRKPYKIPLSNDEINYFNEMVVMPHATYSFSRLHYYMILSAKPDLNILGVLNNKDAYLAEIYEWVEDTCQRLNVVDVCVPGEYTGLLSAVHESSRGEENPLSYYFQRRLENSQDLSCFNTNNALHRACAYLVLIIDGTANTNNIRFLPDAVKDNLFRSAEFLEQLDQNVLQPLYGSRLDIAHFTKVITKKFAKNGIDLLSGRSLSRTASGDRYEYSNPYRNRNRDTLYDIQLIGPLDKASGLGQATRLSATAIKNLPYTHNFYNFDLDNPAPEGFNSPVSSGALGKAKVNLIHLNAESVPFVLAYGEDVFTDSYNIGYFYWELDTPARCHSLALELLDEVWVCTEYGVTQYKEHCDIPVVNVGMTYESQTVPDKEVCRDYLKKEFGVSKHTIVYLATFDSFSFVQRKNPLAVVKAFRECFQGNEDVQLLLKTQNKNFVGDPEQLKIWRATERAIGDDSRIKLINRTFQYDELLKFKKATDCYVSLHRSEGWGFGMIEAMTLGVPVIATNYSGNLEFCKEDNCWLVNASEKYLSESDYIFVEPGQKWAEPDVSHAAELMRDCFENPERRKQKAECAEIFVKEKFANEVISERYRNRLDSIIEGL